MAWVENCTIEFTKAGRYTLYALSDFQIGSSSCNKDLIRRKIKEVASDPNGIVVFLGDIEDDDRPTTRTRRTQSFGDRPEVINADAMKHLAWIDKEVIPILAPLTKMPIGIVGVLAGHHWTQLSPSLNSVQYICNKLGDMGGKKVPYLGEMSAWLYFRFRGQKGFKGKAVKKLVHVQHGVGGGQTLASALTRLERTAQGFPADAYIRAHDCKLVAAKTVEIFPKDTMGKPELMSKDIALLNIGSATQGYNLSKAAPDYVESAMMRPVAMGWGKLHMDVRTAQAWEDKSMNLAVDLGVEL